MKLPVRLAGWARAIREGPAPVFIVSPTGRCGTTVIQRLLASDPSIMVYSEIVHPFSLAWFCSRFLTSLEKKSEALDQERRRYLDDPRFEWLVSVLPPQPDMASASVEAFYRFMQPFHEDARALGRSRWAIKKPGLEVDSVLAMRLFFPDARVIFLERDVLGVLKSHKSLATGSKPVDVEALCDAWLHNMCDWLPQRRAPGHLTITYGDLQERPGEVAAAVARFTGLQALEPQILDVRLNARSETGAGYQAPGELSRPEQDLATGARDAYLRAAAVDDYPVSSFRSR